MTSRDALSLTKEQAAIIGAYTGFICGPFSDIHEYAAKILGRNVWTHEFASEEFMESLKVAACEDFVSITHREKEPDQ